MQYSKDIDAGREAEKCELKYLPGKIKPLEKEIKRKNQQIVELEADVESPKDIMKIA